MTALPTHTTKKLGLLIDLDICVGCHACAVVCKEWNDGGQFGPLSDEDPMGAKPVGVWFNRVHSYTVDPATPAESPEPARACGDKAIPLSGPAGRLGLSLHFPRSCLHCEHAACVTVCPTGASYKRAEDGIVLVDYDKCIGCKLCSWACPYGAREYDEVQGVMKKCTLCVDRIYNTTLAKEDQQPACVLACPTGARMFGDFADPDSAVSQRSREREGQALLPELGYAPTNRYLPPRPRRDGAASAPKNSEAIDAQELPSVLRWLDRVLSR
ncbi:MAG: 4Fe-4S dicluster domain-containing protein [Ahniella sp.]|nr:4Fe-4S dicluster domain-containing protein [Ahniella sp.]